MKYLYMIFRLYRCPHKFKTVDSLNIKLGPQVKAITYINKCSRCGRIESKKVSV